MEKNKIVIKSIGLVLIIITGIYLTFPLWSGWIISRQLPDDLQLQSYEVGYPGFNKITITHLQVKSAGLVYRINDLVVDYALDKLEINNIQIETLEQQTTENIFRLPAIKNEDLQILELFNSISIEQLSLKKQHQSIQLTQLQFLKVDTNSYGISFILSTITDITAKPLKLSSVIKVNEDSLDVVVNALINNNDSFLMDISYQSGPEQIKVIAEFNLNNINSVSHKNILNSQLIAKENLSLEWLQKTQANNLLVVLASDLLIDDIEVSTSMRIETVSEKFPLVATVIIQTKSQPSVNYSHSGVDIQSSEVKANLKALVTLDQFDINSAYLTVENIEFDVSAKQLKIFPAKPIDEVTNLKINNYQLRGTLENIQTHVKDIDEVNWQLSAQLLMPELSGSYLSEAGNSTESNNELIEISSQVLINFTINKNKNLTFQGEVTTSELNISSVNMNYKGKAQINWQDINTTFSEGVAQVVLQSSDSDFFDMKFESTTMETEIRFMKEQVLAEGKLLLNEQLLAPYSLIYTKKPADLSIKLQKNKLANQLINSFLQPFTKGNDAPFTVVAGEVVHSANISFNKDLIIESIFDINDLSFNFGENNLYGLNLSQQVTSFAPLRLESTLTIETINFTSGLEIGNIQAIIKSMDNNSFETTAFSGDLLEGKLFSESIRFDSAGTVNAIIELDDISLTELIFFLEVPGLYGEGKMYFNLPISIQEGVFTVTNGTFKAKDKGILKYSYSETASKSADDKNIALKALENFHYDSLDGMLSYNEKGFYHIKLHLLGANPDLYDGYPVDFVLNLQGELSGVFRSLFLTGNFEEAIIKQVQSQLDQ